MAVEGVSVRLYLDHNVDPRLAEDLRRYGFDVTYAHEVGNRDASDEAHLRWATEHGRAVVTFDLRDFRLLNAEWHQRGETHAGIILSVPPPRISYGELLRRALAFLDRFSADEMVNEVRWLEWTGDR